MVTKILKQAPHTFNELYEKLKNSFSEVALKAELQMLLNIGAIRFKNNKYYK